MIYNNSLYGNYRQVKFTDVFGSADAFLQEYKSSGIPATIEDEEANTLYYLLYARYGNSVIASSDTNQFKYKLLSIIYSSGPAWVKRMELQETFRNFTEDELISGATTIYNHAYNPSTAPGTGTTEELNYINEQTAQKAKRGKLDAYAYLWDLISTDVTTEFINKFAALFLKVVEPEIPLWYVTKLKEDN